MVVHREADRPVICWDASTGIALWTSRKGYFAIVTTEPGAMALWKKRNYGDE
jgi:hypothetical protein